MIVFTKFLLQQKKVKFCPENPPVLDIGFALTLLTSVEVFLIYGLSERKIKSVKGIPEHNS